MNIPLPSPTPDYPASSTWMPPAVACASVPEKNCIRSVKRQHTGFVDGQEAIHYLFSTRIGNFYTRYLRPHAFIQNSVRWAWRHLYPYYIRYNIGKTREERRHLAIVPFTRFVERERLTTYSHAPAEHVSPPPPLVFPERLRSELTLLVPATAPAISVAEIQNALIYGGTNMVKLPDAVVCHDLYDFNHDYTSEELHSRILMWNRCRNVSWVVHDHNPEPLPMAASFVDACASNYAHWLSEVLPRIAMFCTDSRFRHIPLIVNEGLHPNIMESLLLVAGEGREIITLPVGRALKLEKLYVTSVTGYVPFEPRKKRSSRNFHGVFHPQAFAALNARLAALRVPAAGEAWPERIYLRRSCTQRQITNAEEIETLLVARGFATIEPERLSFAQQVRLFTQARVILGASGAALSNAIFCQPGAQVGILIAVNTRLLYGYWSNMLVPGGVRLGYMAGERTQQGVHSGFTIEPRTVLDYLEAIGCN